MSRGRPPEKLSDLITYPAELSIKAMGLKTNDFEEFIVNLVSPIIAPKKFSKVETRDSSGGKYLSVTLHFTAEDEAQYSNVFTTLRSNARVLYTL